MLKISFTGSPPRPNLKGKEIPQPQVPCLYFLCKAGGKAPFYIGEYGQAKTYNVVERIKRHFANSGTLARVSKNSKAFNFKIPTSFDAYIKKLPDGFKDKPRRASLEAWVIQKVCHQHKMQATQFCVTKYIVPQGNYSVVAKKIIDEFRKCSSSRQAK